VVSAPISDRQRAKADARDSFRQWLGRHALIAYFLIAYAGCWLLAIPLVFSQRGLGVINIPDGLALALFLLPSFTGPFFAAIFVTAATQGRDGVRQLLGQVMRWRVGARWYLVAFIGYPAIFALGYVPVLGAAPLVALVQQWPMLFTVYLPTALASVFITAIGEETGWRGFALPRLQLRFGPLAGSLILAALHALWHTPAYFIPGAILPGAFDPTVFVANSLAIVAETVLWTWIFNNAKGSVLIAILVHALSNGNSNYFPQIIALPNNPWSTFEILGVCALVIICATRGRLGYAKTLSSDQIEASRNHAHSAQ
jgi:membrane protease YdiL (CAAX protease family)